MAAGAPGLRVLFTRQQIAARVAEMGQQISRDFRGQEVLLVGVLKGAVAFLRELERNLTIPADSGLMGVASYGGSQVSSRRPQLTLDLAQPVQGRNVILVEDILDTGFTLSFLAQLLRQRSPRCLRAAVFLDKPARRATPFAADYVGFTISDEFVVGYGMDYNQKYRELEDICVLQAIEEKSIE